MNIRYRSDIDGLRAIAVLLVFAYHLKTPLFSGGFVGVDVFFVISGFLITGIVIKAIDDGKFSFISFFNRRIKRIVPNVFVVSTCTLIAGWFFLLPNDFSSLIKSYFYTSIYSANFYFLDVTGAYFAQATDEMPLLHMWSLSVEEQFYFIWPVILFISLRFYKGNKLGIITIIFAVVSFIISNRIAYTDSGFAYYMLHTRSGGLLLGASLAILHRDYKKIREFNSWIIVLVGTILIIWTSVSLTPNSIFPGVNSAIPSLGALLVIAGGSGFKTNIISKAFSLKPLALIGLISFSVYLWHWPLIAFSAYLGILDSHAVKLSIFITTIALSVFSLKIIENPIRKSSISFLVSFTTINISFILIASIAFVYSSYTDGMSFRLSNGTLSAKSVDVRFAGLDEGWCHVSAEGVTKIPFSKNMEHCHIGDKNGKKKAIYIGDSNAGHFAPFVDELARKASVNVRQLSTQGCWPTLKPEAWGENPDVCLKFRQEILRSIPNDKYDYIIVANNWERDSRFTSYKTEDYNSLFGFYSKHAKKVIILAQMPEFRKNPAECFRRKQCTSNDDFHYLPAMHDANAIISAAAKNYKNVEVIDASSYMIRNGKYSPFAMGYLMYHDTGHISIKGMKWVVQEYQKDNKTPFN